MIPYEKFYKTSTSFEENMSQNDILSSHITVSSTILCPAYYIVSWLFIKNATKVAPRIFCKIYHFCIKGVKGFIKCDLQEIRNSYFSPKFDGDFSSPGQGHVYLKKISCETAWQNGLIFGMYVASMKGLL